MLPLFIFYFKWHFIEKPKEILSGLRNLLFFNFYFFSTRILILTLFSPYKRILEGYPPGFNPKKILEVFSANLISRLIGFFSRLFLILFSLVSAVSILFAGVFWFIFWLLLPFLIIVSAATSIIIIF